MLNRLTDRIESGPDGEYVVARFGMWGVSAEVERHKRKWFVVHPNGKKKNFKTKTDAELYMKELFERR